METIQCGKRIYKVVSKEATKDKYPNIYKHGCTAVIVATFGETLFSIAVFANGKRKVMRAFL